MSEHTDPRHPKFFNQGEFRRVKASHRARMEQVLLTPQSSGYFSARHILLVTRQTRRDLAPLLSPGAQLGQDTINALNEFLEMLDKLDAINTEVIENCRAAG